MIVDFHSSKVTSGLCSWTVRRHHAAAAVFIASYAVAWAYLVGLTDPARWDVLLAIGFGVLFALVLIHEIVATARSLRTNGPQAPLPASVGAGRHAVVTTPPGHGTREFHASEIESATLEVAGTASLAND
jgi:hypothetical protein